MELRGYLIKTYIRKRLSRVCFELELAADEATELSALAMELSSMLRDPNGIETCDDNLYVLRSSLRVVRGLGKALGSLELVVFRLGECLS